MAQTSAAPAGTSVSLRQQFADVFTKEHATTMKVLNAFPPDQGSFTPHERSSTATMLVWTLAIGTRMAADTLRGPLNLEGGFPPPPATFREAVSAYEAGARTLLETLAATPDARMRETIKFFTAPKQMGDVPVNEMVWMCLLDTIHHRGQLSVYLRLAGGKVPSIYGPSADEPWM